MTNKIITRKIAEPYATALRDIGISTNTLSLITIDVNKLKQIFKENPLLQKYLTNPLVLKDSKKEILKKIIESEIFNKNTRKFIMILIERSRIDIFPVIAEKYLELANKFIKLESVQITSALPLSIDQEKEIIKQLKKRIDAQEIKLFTNVDKSLIGGLKIQIGSTIIDLSLKGQLQELASKLETSLF